MNHTTETALRASIAHWEDVVMDPVNTDVGASYCALCREFHEWFNRDIEKTCSGCPVYEFTGDDLCGSTPYGDYDDAVYAKEDETELRRLATLELEFLKSLLP